MIVCVTEKYVRCPHVPAVNDALTSTRAVTEKPFWWTRAPKHVLPSRSVVLTGTVCDLKFATFIGRTLCNFYWPFLRQSCNFPYATMSERDGLMEQFMASGTSFPSLHAWPFNPYFHRVRTTRITCADLGPGVLDKRQRKIGMSLTPHVRLPIPKAWATRPPPFQLSLSQHVVSARARKLAIEVLRLVWHHAPTFIVSAVLELPVSHSNVVCMF